MKNNVFTKLLFLLLVFFCMGDMGKVEASPETTYNEIDYEAVFDAEYYAAMNNDVATAFTNDEESMFLHFVSNGMSEGRIASAEFNVAEYIAFNPDLVELLGTESLVPYYMHYITVGKDEGRIGSVYVQQAQIEEEKRVYELIIGLKSTYPEGTNWTNDISYQFKGANYIGYGCAAFSFLASDTAFGNAPIHEHNDYTKIRVGDILRINNDTHSVIVLEVHDNYVVIAEGNYNKSVHWGRILTNNELANKLNYVWSRY